MNIQPFKENPDSPLFISFSKKNKFKSFESGGFNGIIKGLAHVNMLWCRLTREIATYCYLESIPQVSWLMITIEIVEKVQVPSPFLH